MTQEEKKQYEFPSMKVDVSDGENGFKNVLVDTFLTFTNKGKRYGFEIHLGQQVELNNDSDIENLIKSNPFNSTLCMLLTDEDYRDEKSTPDNEIGLIKKAYNLYGNLN